MLTVLFVVKITFLSAQHSGADVYMQLQQFCAAVGCLRGYRVADLESPGLFHFTNTPTYCAPDISTSIGWRNPRELWLLSIIAQTSKVC